MVGVEPPTGDEKPQKYYGGAYLDEVENLKLRANQAAVMGEKLDVSEEHPLTVAAVSPHLLKESKQRQVDLATPDNTTADGYQTLEHKTHVEANGDEEWRVNAAIAEDNDNKMNARPVPASENDKSKDAQSDDVQIPVPSASGKQGTAAKDEDDKKDALVTKREAPKSEKKNSPTKKAPAKKAAAKKSASSPVKLDKKK